MIEEGNRKGLIEKLIPRVLKATLWGALTYVFVYYLPMLIYPMDLLPLEYSQLFYLFVGITVFFTVVTKLFSGTILEHAFGIARALIMIIYFIAVFDGGIISLTMPMMGTTVNLAVDLKAFLTILILVNLLGIAKSMFQATKFLAKKVETSQLSVG
ncbi:MAG: hypothetical protein OEX76_03820 [Candidatus Bathyarchaeota archaeon]|nr:hypothetical protein [Candidatus Bathyarchaeota archaeon]MDH5713255.1 hypothetical protein [Candidatus Bathyarchaeota archaeon]